MPKRKKSSDTNNRNRRARYNTEHISNDTAHEEQTDLSCRIALKFIGCASLGYYENGHKSLPSNNDIGIRINVFLLPVMWCLHVEK